MSHLVNIFLSTLVCLTLLGHGVALTGNCSLAEPLYVFQDTVGFQIHPMRLEAFPAYQGRRAAAIGVLWEPRVMMERNRTFYDTDGVLLNEPVCSYPVGLLNDPYNDDQTAACNKRLALPCGVILQQIPFEECDCTTTTTVDIFYGVERTTFATVYTHQLYPHLRIKFNAYLVNESVFVYPFNDPTNENAIKWDYAIGRLKFGYEFNNFPWLEPNATVTLGPNNNGTFIYGAYATSLVVSQGVVEVNQTAHALVARFTSSNGSLGLELGVDTGAIVDGIPFNDPLATGIEYNVYNFTAAYLQVPDDPLLTYTISNGWSNLHICEQQVAQWKNATFDPYLTALFTPDPTQPQSKQSKTVVIASTVTVAAVVLLLAAFVTLVCTVPALKSRVLPSTQRFPVNGASKGLPDANDAHRQTTKPSQKSTTTAPAATPVAPAPAPAPVLAPIPVVNEPAPARAAAWSNAARPAETTEAAEPEPSGWARSARPSV